jgi:quercetin dioxygenase-like cupin family protein
MSKVFRYDDVKLEDVTTEGALKVSVRWLITKEMGAKNFAMRIFEIEAGGQSPLHKHPWEHEVFILLGQGQLFNGEKTVPFKAEDVVFVPPDEMHQFKNNGKTSLRFICLIPYAKE